MSSDLRDVEDDLDLPRRRPKPRKAGITVLIDPGAPTAMFEDVIDSHGPLIDFVKFGWGTALVTRELERKIRCLRRSDVEFFFGGTLFEKFVLQGRFDGFRSFCFRHGCRWVEVSNGTIPMPGAEKTARVAALSADFSVISDQHQAGARRQVVADAPDPVARRQLLGAGGVLANVALADVVGLETLRLGLRADTLLEGLEIA